MKTSTRTTQIVAIAIALGAAATASAGVGSKYAARDPVTCDSTKAPASGAPSAQQALQYTKCGEEGEDSFHHLILTSDMRVEIGKGRPFQGGGNSDINMHDVDPSQPIYPIRGSYKMYQCSNVAAGDPWQSIYTAGKNCDVYDYKAATGACYKTTFGDWKCFMTDTTNTSPVQSSVAGPK